MFRHLLEIPTDGRGLRDITPDVLEVVRRSGVRTGLCHLFIQHTSASLLVQENADPDVLHDLNAWFTRAVPDGDALYTHTAEGPDDMPGHVRTALTAVSVTLPVGEGTLMLGTWQAVYLFEHRRRGQARRVVITVF
jgi:secondary thiamine-phosphate synthase enzyme